MARTHFQNLSLITATVALVVSTACHKKPPVVPAPPPAPPPPVVANVAPPPPPPQPPPPTPPVPASPQPTEDEIFARMTLTDLNAQKPLDDVFFDLDKSDLSDKARASLDKDAAWMKRWTTTRVTVEGHGDSRGTNEYNLALGERRGVAARDYLVSLGIPAARLTVVSKGEEQPFCTEENEGCWAQNRRGHLIVIAK